MTTTARPRGRRRTTVRVGVTLTAAALLSSAIPSLTPAQAAGGVHTIETGRVKAIADGDTVWVDIAGDHSKRLVRVRLAGIQATETSHQGKGKTWCHGLPAKAELSRLVLHKKVQLRARSAGSRSLGRPLRYVFVKQHGHWVDVQKILLNDGQAMSLTLEHENSYDKAYGYLAQVAALKPRGLWLTTTCGVGPEQSVPLHTWVRWDADGGDGANPNGEYVVFENRSPTTALSLRGWGARDTSQALYAFPSWARIEPNSFVRLHPGHGTNTATDFYWNLSAPLFQNPDDSPGTTEFAVLMDPHGDFRSWATYPCQVACADPLSGKVRISQIVADAPGDDNQFVNGEQIVVTNTSQQDLRLGGYYLSIGGPYFMYSFSPNRVLPAGGSVTVKMGHGTTDADTIYLDQSHSRLSNTGGSVKLTNWDVKKITCSTWGNGHC